MSIWSDFKTLKLLLSCHDSFKPYNLGTESISLLGSSEDYVSGLSYIWFRRIWLVCLLLLFLKGKDAEEEFGH